MRQKRLLLVEDDPLVQQAYRNLLRRWEVVATGTLREAEEALRASSFDVVVLDLILPDGDARQLRAELTHRTDLLLLVVSGYLRPTEAEAWSRQGTLVFEKDTPWTSVLRAIGEDPEDEDRGDHPTTVALDKAAGQLAKENGLTGAETNVLLLTVRGLSAKQAAAKLGRAQNTVDRQLTHLRRKFGAENQHAVLAMVASRALHSRL